MFDEEFEVNKDLFVCDQERAKRMKNASHKQTNKKLPFRCVFVQKL